MCLHSIVIVLVVIAVAFVVVENDVELEYGVCNMNYSKNVVFCEVVVANLDVEDVFVLVVFDECGPDVF